MAIVVHEDKTVDAHIVGNAEFLGKEVQLYRQLRRE
jgi:hypothetical protein